MREIVVRPDELEPVVLEKRGVDAAGAHGLALEDEIGDPADQILDAHRGVVRELECAHGVSIGRGDQELVKHRKEFSEPAQKLLG